MARKTKASTVTGKKKWWEFKIRTLVHTCIVKLYAKLRDCQMLANLT